MAAQPHPVTESGQSVVFENGFPAPLKSCTVTFGPVQSGTGDPSPENVRTITGRTGLSVFVSPTSSGGTEYPVSWTDYGTVYGGTVDLMSGLLTVTHKKATVDGTTSIQVLNSGLFVVVTQSDMTVGNHYSDPCAMCDKCIKVNLMGDVPNTELAVRIGADDSKLYFYYFNTAIGISSKSAISAWLAENPITYTYPLANPVAYQLPASAVREIRGENHIWSDAGDISAIYYTI